MGRLDYLSGLVIAQDDPGAMILVKIFVPEIKRAEESASQVLSYSAQAGSILRRGQCCEPWSAVGWAPLARVSQFLT